MGWVKAKVVRRGEGGFEYVTTPAPRTHASPTVSGLSRQTVANDAIIKIL